VWFRLGRFPLQRGSQRHAAGDDNNIALRLRGYFNVPATLAGKVIDFGLNCDDFCSLTIGSTPVIPVADERVSARVIRQVTFQDPGLYPVELVYYQNGSTGYLEWSRTTAAVPECPNDICGTPLTDPSYNRAFTLIVREELYSSRVEQRRG
jgi:outer membrane exchange protein TraA